MNIPLLVQLRDAGDRYVALTELGPALDRVRADLDELAAFGFAIERHPYLGAAYRGPAERLCPDQIEHELDTLRVGRRIAVWNRVSSTNDVAARAASSTANDGLVILAEEQAAGRGRHGRSWHAPARSSVLMSVLLFPPEALATTAWLTALGAVATAEVVAAWTGLDARIKWPNDVRVGGRKVAGILVERSAGAVIGIGLNANVASGDFGLELHETATSFRILSGQPVDRSELVRRLIVRLDHWYDAGLAAGPSSLSPRWRELSEHLHQPVRVQRRAGDVVGNLDDINLLHGLTVSVPGGSRIQIPTVEVLGLAAVPGEGPAPSSSATPGA